jgi:hypothetical protein
MTMLTLCATGKSSLDDVTPMYLWAYGNYRYEIEVKRQYSYSSNCEVFESSYEDALSKFSGMVKDMTWDMEDGDYGPPDGEGIPLRISGVFRMRARLCSEF